MQKTQNYNLNQWEATDALSRKDFNRDNAAIDAAIKAVADAASSKASAESVAAVNQSVSALQQSITAHDTSLTALAVDLGSGGSNCRIATGSYTGTGKYGSSNKNSLTLPFAPKVIFIFPSQAAVEINTNYNGMFGVGLVNAGVLLNTNQYSITTPLTTLSVSGSKITWYDIDNVFFQFNLAATYYYVALG